MGLHGQSNYARPLLLNGGARALLLYKDVSRLLCYRVYLHKIHQCNYQVVSLLAGFKLLCNRRDLRSGLELGKLVGGRYRDQEVQKEAAERREEAENGDYSVHLS